MEASFEIDKIIKCAICDTLFFPSGGDDVLIRLSLIIQIIKEVNLMCISFSVKHTDILGIMIEFVQYVQNYFQYLYITI